MNEAADEAYRKEGLAARVPIGAPAEVADEIEEEQAPAEEFIQSLYHLIDHIDDALTIIAYAAAPTKLVHCGECIYWNHRDITGDRIKLTEADLACPKMMQKCQRCNAGILKLLSDGCFNGREMR